MSDRSRLEKILSQVEEFFTWWEKAQGEILGQGQDRCILVWEFCHAPEVLQKLSTNGGDEDWLALVPETVLKNNYIPWLGEGCFGCCTVEEHRLPGYRVFIGCHA